MKLKALDPLAPKVDLEMEADRVAEELAELNQIAPPIPEEHAKSALNTDPAKGDSLKATSRRLAEFLRFMPKRQAHLAPQSKLARAIKAYQKFKPSISSNLPTQESDDIDVTKSA